MKKERMGLGIGLNFLLLLAMVATNIVSLYHLSSTSFFHRNATKPSPLPVPNHLLHQLATIRATISHLTDSLSSLSSLCPATAGEKLLTTSKIDDLRSWLSAAVTDQETCLDTFEGVARDLRDRLATAMHNSTRFTSNNLAITSSILGVLNQLNIPLHRKGSLGLGLAISSPACRIRALREDSSAFGEGSEKEGRG